MGRDMISEVTTAP